MSSLGIDSSMERSEVKRVRLLNQINTLIFLFVPIYYVLIYYFFDWRAGLLLSFTGAGIIFTLYLSKLRKFATMRIFTFFVMWATATSFTILLGNKVPILNLFYGVSIFPFLIYSIKERLKIVILLLVSILSAVVLFWLQENQILTSYIDTTYQSQYILSFVLIVMVILVITLSVASLSFINFKSERELLKTLKQTEELNAITQEQNEELATTEKSLQNALKQLEEDKKEMVMKNNELQAQEEEMRQTVEELTSVNEQITQQEQKLLLKIEENKLQLYQIEQQEEVMRTSFEELHEKTEQMEAQEAIMQQAMIEMNRINEELQTSEQRLEGEVKRRTEQIGAQNKALEHSYLALESKTRTLHQSINYAKHIQNAILPPQMVIKALFPESFILYKPKDIVSGDFYWIDRKVNENGGMRIAIAAVDCTGHGVPGAIMSMIGYNLLNQYSNQATLDEPNLLIQKLHQGVIQSLQQEQTENRDGMDLSICVYDSEKQTIDFVGAKNPLIYIQNNELHEIKGTNASVGGAFYKNKDIRFEKHTIDVSIPTTIYLYSDGYQDQFGGKDGRKFMKSKFKTMLFENYQKPIEEQHKLFSRTFNKWKENEDQVDDVLLIGLKINT
jgi:hypothetical protein